MSTSSQAYSELSGATVLTTQAWDDPFIAIPLGFDFEFLGSTESTISVSSDWLGGVISISDTQYPEIQDLMFIYGSDIIDVGILNDENISLISLLVEGSIGSRIAKIEWNNVGFYDEVFGPNQSTNNRISFQLWIYETSGDFEIRFGDNTITNPDLIHFGGVPFIAFTDDYIYDTDEVSGSWAVQGSVDNPAIGYYSNIFDLENPPGLDGDPASGTVYRFSKNAVGLSENLSDDDSKNWSLFPNPVVEFIELRFDRPLDKNWQLDVVDMRGELVFSRSINQNTKRISVQELASGMYFATLSNGTEKQTLKFVKQ